LASDWANAKLIVESQGGKFLAVLQPVAYLGSPNLTHLPEVRENELLKEQFAFVYPMFKEELKKAGLDYLDLTNIFDGQEILYFDFCHVSPPGNRKAARAIADRLGHLSRAARAKTSKKRVN